MHREGVEDFVGQDECVDRSVRRGGRRTETRTVAGRIEPRRDRLEAARLHLDRLVADHRLQVGPLCGESRRGWRSRASPSRPRARGAERIRAPEPVPRIGHGARQRGPEDRVGLGRGQEVTFAAGSSGFGTVVAAVRVVEREVHEAGEGHRAVAGDLLVDPGHETGILADGLEVRCRVATEARGHLHRRVARLSADDQPDTRPDEGVPAEQDRDRRRRRRRGQVPEPWVRDPVREEQVRGVSVLGDRPARLVRAQAMREEHARVHDRGIAEAGEVRAQRPGPVPVEQGADHRGGRSLTVAAGAQAPLLHEGTGPRGGRPLQPRECRGGRATGDQELGSSVAGHAPDAFDGSRDSLQADAAGAGHAGHVATTGQDDVERAVDVDRKPPPPTQVANFVPGHLVEPARQRVVGRQVREIGENLGCPGDRDDVGGVPVVGQGESVGGAGDGHEVAPVAIGRQRDRARPEDDEPGRCDRHGPAGEAAPRTTSCRAARSRSGRRSRRPRRIVRNVASRLARAPGLRSAPTDRRREPAPGA